MASDNVEAVAKEYGLWDGQGEFVWFKAYNSRKDKKNFAIRDWFVFNTLAPSLGLSMDDPSIPFSIKPEHKVSAREVFKLLRGTYEGTQYDMCKDWKMVNAKGDTLVSPVANPWLVADTRNTLNTIAPGTVEFVRTLAVCWCSYSTVLQLRSWLPDGLGGILWYGVDNPAESPRIPIFAGGTALPAAFDNCGQKQYVPDCVLWTFRRPNRLGTVAWQKNKDDFEKLILETEDLAFEGLPALEKNPSPTALNAYTAQIYEQCAKRWNELEEKLWIKHGRGF